jgi:ATP-dependent Clp protease ATP-binding subunit ClpA
MDEVGALQQILPKSKRKINIGVSDIENIVAKLARIPSRQVNSDDKSQLQNLEKDLKLGVFGQDNAVDSLSTAIKLSRSGLSPVEQPMGSFLFAGPTGVGKTEICKQLSRIIGVKLLRFDMSEYMERHSISKLIGSPPGYVGYDEGGLLTEAVNSNDKSQLQNLEKDLKLGVFGQDSAVDSLSTAIKLSRSGLSPVGQPMGSFLFAGPTGVGKTEICEQLSRIMGVKLLRFDMSEYMERHSISKLIGSPPGYVGYDEGGLLTEAVNSNPYAVLLLDEIEKAHPDIFNLLLQVMDHGMLTDANGREVDFRNVILVMTSNVGAQNVQRASIGFNEQDHSLDYEGELKKTFTPEFRNRLSEIIYFNSLSEDVVVYVVNKFIFELEDVLEQKNVSLIVSDNARKWFAENGYDSKMGARPMIRLIEKEIRKPLADELLFGKLSQGGTVKVGVNKDKITLNIS